MVSVFFVLFCLVLSDLQDENLSLDGLTYKIKL